MTVWVDPDKIQWLWCLAPLFILFALSEAFKRNAVRRFAGASFLPQVNCSLSVMRRWARFLFLMTAMALLAVALARPQGPGKKVQVTHEGIDIVIAVDVSDSMLAEDIRPNRLEKAKLELQDLVEIARGDRIGVVAFAGDAHGQVPLTLDRSAVKLFLKSLTTGMIPVPGTALGRAISVSARMFDPESEGGKVIILLTDGEDHKSEPLKAAEAAAAMGIRVFTVGLGSAKGDVIPVKMGGRKASFKRDLFGNVVVSKLDEKTLTEVARLTGGAYFRSRRGLLEVDRIYRTIRTMKQTETGSGWVTEPDPLYQLPAFLALCFGLLSLVFGDRSKEESL